MKKSIKILSLKKNVISNLEMRNVSGGVIGSCTPTSPIGTITVPPTGGTTGGTTTSRTTGYTVTEF